MKVKDAMHVGVQWVGPDTPVSDVADIMRAHDVGSVPIGENDRLIGMVTDRDIVIHGVAKSADLSALTARDVMSEGIVYCRDTEDLGDALRIMEHRKIRRLPVLNAQKRMIGMLSLGDVSHSASRELTGELTAAVSAHHA